MDEDNKNVETPEVAEDQTEQEAVANAEGQEPEQTADPAEKSETAE